MRNVLLFGVVLLSVLSSACWMTAQEGTVVVKTNYDQIERLIRPVDRGVYDYNQFFVKYYPINLQSHTQEVQVGGTSKDNAGLKLTIQVSYQPIDTDESLMAYVRDFGLTDEARQEKLLPRLLGQLSTETKTAINQYDAYALMANQEGVRQTVMGKLVPVFAEQFHLKLEAVQVTTKPLFDDERLETAASGVVAATKKKAEESALKDAADIQQQRRAIEAKVFENPKMLELEIWKYKVQYAQAWAAHQGTLVLNGESQMMLQDK